MKYRFIEALNNFLSSEGRDDLINPQLDCHSTIQLALKEFPAINIDLTTDDILFWCNIADYNAVYLEANSHALLQQLLTYTPQSFQPGQPALALVDETLVLSAVMKPEALTDPSLFAQSLEEFYERSHQLRTVMTV